MVIDLLKRLKCMFIFYVFLISFKYDFQVDAERIIVRMGEMSRNQGG